MLFSAIFTALTANCNLAALIHAKECVVEGIAWAGPAACLSPRIGGKMSGLPCFGFGAAGYDQALVK